MRSYSPARRLFVYAVWLLAVLIVAAPARAARTSQALRAHLARELALSGPRSGGYAYDITASSVLFSQRAAIRRPPASVEKLYTAVAALERMGPTARLATTVLGSGRLSESGVWEGALYLRGGGDPTFGSSAFIASRYGGIGTPVSALVEQLANTGIRGVSGPIYADPSYLDSLPGDPYSHYRTDPELEGRLSGLAFDRGAGGSHSGLTAPAAYAADQLRSALRTAEIHVSGAGGVTRAPADAVLLASAPSPTLSELLGLTLPPSDNYFAETLIKDLGARFGTAGSTAGGAAVVMQTITARFGLHPLVVDGSGLSRGDRTSPYEVTDMLVELQPSALWPWLWQSLAVAGRSGTLAQRMRHTAAAGRCHGKTGTLDGVSNLAGYCQAVNGHMIAFAFFNDGIATDAAHRLQDNMAASLASY